MRTEQELDFLEAYIPKLADSAIQKAYLDTLSLGNSLLETFDGKLYEVFPDGTKKFIKDMPMDITINKKVFTL